MLRIEEENEHLMEGTAGWQHRALISDPHWIEVAKHLEILENPDLRQPGAEQVQQAVLEAVQEHLNLFKACPPEIILMNGGEKALAIWQQMMAMEQPAQPAGPQSASGTQPAPHSGPVETPSAQDNFAKKSMAAPPTQPRQPVNPATGQRAPGASGVTDGS